MNVPGQINHPKVEKAIRKVIVQCNKYGVAPGIHLSKIEDVRKWRNEGMRFITYSYDIRVVKRGNAGSYIRIT